MTIWTYKSPIAALALLILSACESGQGAALFKGLSAPTIPGQRAKPLSQVQMAGGAMTLVAPRGFCIDSKSVKKQFAMIARCDVLGVAQAAADAPLGFITVSVLPLAPDSALPAMQDVAAANGLTNASDATLSDDSLVFRAQGKAPIDGVSDKHWRGTARIGDHIIGLALYGPDNGRAVSNEGHAIISDVILRSQNGS